MHFHEMQARTLREAPADAKLPSHQLALRAALARPLSDGLWAYLPLGWRAIERLMRRAQAEFRAIGFHEMRFPLAQPADLWRSTGRWDTFGPALQRLSARSGDTYALGPAYEEAITKLAQTEIDSHRQLPSHLFAIQPRFRDTQPRDGLFRLRESLVAEAFSLHAHAENLHANFDGVLDAYKRIFATCEVDAQVVKAPGNPSNGRATAFMLQHTHGKEGFAACTSCEYAASLEAADFVPTPGTAGEAEPMEKVATPGADTIAGLAEFLDIPTHQTLKAVLYSRQHDRKLVFALLRGDLDINEAQLSHAIGGGQLRPATDDEILEAGASPGYASPVGLEVRPELTDASGMLVVADPSIQHGVNFASGANEDGYHFVNVNYPRDFDVTVLTSIAAVPEGATCAQCGGPLRVERAFELGRCIEWGPWFSEALNVTYLDESGERQPVLMGAFGLELDALLGAIIETHHDEHGIVWPETIAPFQTHLLALGKDESVYEVADRLYTELAEAGVEVLYDDRLGVSAGVKFNDADLIGLPLRVTVGERGIKEGIVELKARTAEEREAVPLEEAVGEIARRVQEGLSRG